MVAVVGWGISFEAPTIPGLQTDSSDLGPSTLRENPCVIPSEVIGDPTAGDGLLEGETESRAGPLAGLSSSRWPRI